MSDPTPPGHFVTCPGCARTLHVPPEAVGKPAHCPHCKANFCLPANPDGSPGEPVLVKGRVSIPKAVAGPGFALLAVGIVGVVLNGSLLLSFFLNENTALDYARFQIRELRKQEVQPTDEKGKPKEPPAPTPELVAADEEWAKDIAGVLVPLHAAFLALSLLTLAGGGATLAGRLYPLAFLGCAAAAVNVNNFCCVPGVAAGLWTVLVLVRDDGRRHFGKSSG